MSAPGWDRSRRRSSASCRTAASRCRRRWRRALPGPPGCCSCCCGSVPRRAAVISTRPTDDPVMPYPVTVTIEPALTNRNRLTTAFRLLLAIPHAILVGGVGFSYAFDQGHGRLTSLSGETGLLGVVAGVLAIISWFTIM